MSTWSPVLQAQRQHFEKLLDAYLTQTKSYVPEDLYAAVCYTTQAPAKRIRPLLVYTVGERFNLPTTTLDPIALSIELIHCYTLVHDDLPAMDNDLLRRGRPTCHIAFNEATAILVGDALQSLAFQCLSTPSHTIAPHQQVQLIHLLSQAIGMQGMVAGQHLDLALSRQGQHPTPEAFETLYQLKTARLMQVCLTMPAILASTPTTTYTALNTLGKAIGVLYQLNDDRTDEALKQTETNSYRALGTQICEKKRQALQHTIQTQCNVLNLTPKHAFCKLLYTADMLC